MKLTIITFTSRHRLCKKWEIADTFIMKKQAQQIINEVAPTAILHTLDHFDLTHVHHEVVSKPGNVEKASEVIIEQEANIPT